MSKFLNPLEPLKYNLQKTNQMRKRTRTILTLILLVTSFGITEQQCLPKRPFKTADNPYSKIDRTGISTTLGSAPILIPAPNDPLCYSTGFWFQIASDAEPTNTEYLLMQYSNPVLQKVYLTKTSVTEYKLMAEFSSGGGTLTGPPLEDPTVIVADKWYFVRVTTEATKVSIALKPFNAAELAAIEDVRAPDTPTAST